MVVTTVIEFMIRTFLDGYRGTVVTVGMVGAKLAMNLARWCGGPRNTIVNVQKRIEKCSSEHQKNK
jgi:hypothetical protein